MQRLGLRCFLLVKAGATDWTTQGFFPASSLLRHCPFPNSTGHRMGWHSDDRCPWVHVCVNPFLAARGPGQPPNSRCGDREAADAGAAPSGCPEACAGEQVSPREQRSGWRAAGSCAFSLSSKLSFPSLERNLFLTSVCGLFVWTGSRAENESGRESPGRLWF